MKKPSNSGRGIRRARLITSGVKIDRLKSHAAGRDADGVKFVPRSVANRPKRLIAPRDIDLQPAALAARRAASAKPSIETPLRARRFAPIDYAASCLVAAPLLALAAYIVMKPHGLADAVSRSFAISQAKPTLIAAQTAQPAAATLAPIDQIAIVARPEAEVLLSDPAADLIPALAAESLEFAGRERRCEIEDDAQSAAAPLSAILTSPELSAEQFGKMLADAALTQTREFVVYKDSYRRLKFPHGDVSALFGVCTDVIIRAYRAVGVDLQSLVHRSGVGRGDTSIDHRRTEVLRRFFAANGASLTPSDIPEEYLPGDVVSYHRPQNTGSQSHIAIVSDVIGVSGRQLIVHNRGWGPQLEDALFVDRITGHYRYSGQSTSIAQSRPVSGPRRPAKINLKRRAADNRSVSSRSVASGSSAGAAPKSGL